MPILMFSNLKGGVAKTTNAVAVAECLAWRGHKTLVIDADHQCTASELLVGEDRFLKFDGQKATLHDLLKEMVSEDITPIAFDNYVVPEVSDILGGLENLSLIPCSMRIDDFQTNIAKAKMGFKSNDDFLKAFYRQRAKFKRWLTDNFEYTIIDCPPSVAVQVRMLFTAADSYVVPCLPDHLSLRGAKWLQERLRRLSVGTKPLGTLWSMYRANVATHKKVIEDAAKSNGHHTDLPKPFKTVIPNAAAIAAALEPNRKPTTFNNKYTGPFAHLYSNLCDEIMARCDAAETE